MRTIFLALFACTIISVSASAKDPRNDAVSHSIWDGLLKKHVSATGQVDYKGLKADRATLKTYLDMLSSHPPQDIWSETDRMAYWMNAYNAFTVELILQNYPVKSIRDISEPWKKKWIKIGGTTYSLDFIENGILRKDFSDPRIHFGIVCASYSCPKLHNAAFTGANTNAMLDKLTKGFVNDPKRNKISANAIQISEIFNWFKGDFTKSGTVIEFLNKYSTVKISAGAKTTYMEYSWALNE